MVRSSEQMVLLVVNLFEPSDESEMSTLRYFLRVSEPMLGPSEWLSVLRTVKRKTNTEGKEEGEKSLLPL